MFKVLSTLSHSSFNVSCFIIMSYILFDLILTQSKRQSKRHRPSFRFSTCRYPVFPAIFVDDAIFFQSCVLCSFVKNKLCVIDSFLLSIPLSAQHMRFNYSILSWVFLSLASVYNVPLYIFWSAGLLFVIFQNFCLT
jgi:hypothetical protein